MLMNTRFNPDFVFQRASESPAEQAAFIKVALREIGKLREDVHRVITPRSSLANPSATSSGSGDRKKKVDTKKRARI
jgi:hypothetical protein